MYVYDLVFNGLFLLFFLMVGKEIKLRFLFQKGVKNFLISLVKRLDFLFMIINSPYCII